MKEYKYTNKEEKSIPKYKKSLVLKKSYYYNNKKG